jgi:hypothetical protein
VQDTRTAKRKSPSLQCNVQEPSPQSLRKPKAVAVVAVEEVKCRVQHLTSALEEVVKKQKMRRRSPATK